MPRLNLNPADTIESGFIEECDLTVVGAHYRPFRYPPPKDGKPRLGNDGKPLPDRYSLVHEWYCILDDGRLHFPFELPDGRKVSTMQFSCGSLYFNVPTNCGPDIPDDKVTCAGPDGVSLDDYVNIDNKNGQVNLDEFENILRSNNLPLPSEWFGRYVFGIKPVSGGEYGFPKSSRWSHVIEYLFPHIPQMAETSDANLYIGTRWRCAMEDGRGKDAGRFLCPVAYLGRATDEQMKGGGSGGGASAGSTVPVGASTVASTPSGLLAATQPPAAASSGLTSGLSGPQTAAAGVAPTPSTSPTASILRPLILQRVLNADEKGWKRGTIVPELMKMDNGNELLKGWIPVVDEGVANHLYQQQGDAKTGQTLHLAADREVATALLAAWQSNDEETAAALLASLG